MLKNKNIKVLMVDDHPLIVEGYKNIFFNLENISEVLTFETSLSIEQAYNKIEASINEKKFDVIFLDLNMPIYKEGEIFSGEDFALYIRERSPVSKIIFLTMQEDKFRLFNLVENIRPEGLLIKSEVGTKEIGMAFLEVLKGNLFYSNKFEKKMNNDFAFELTLDKIDRQILFYLSKGFRTKELPDLIPLSLAAIESRKRVIKNIFKLANKDGDINLINKAKEGGFL